MEDNAGARVEAGDGEGASAVILVGEHGGCTLVGVEGSVRRGLIVEDVCVCTHVYMFVYFEVSGLPLNENFQI